MELVYQYLTGPKFRHRLEAIVEKFSDMQADLDRERKTMTRLWAKREAQIQGVVESTTGMYGDLQGIAGKTFHEIEGLRIPLLEAPMIVRSPHAGRLSSAPHPRRTSDHQPAAHQAPGRDFSRLIAVRKRTRRHPWAGESTTTPGLTGSFRKRRFVSFFDPRDYATRSIVDLDQVDAVDTKLFAFNDDLDDTNDIS
jgi:hypothetical protein